MTWSHARRCAAPASAAATPVHPTREVSTGDVATVTYDLGDQAYRPPGTGEPVEMAATVHYPKALGTTSRPLVVQPHGWHETCADRTAQEARDAAALANDEYASVGGDLINRHLALWQQLDATGRGALAGVFRDAATGKPRGVDFRYHVDLNRVGAMGHSRDGAGETWRAADRLPAGVRIGAVLPLAPAYNVMTEDMTAYEITKTPLAVVRGTCDGQVGREALTFAADAAAENSSPADRGRPAPGRRCLHRRLLPEVPRRRRAAVGRVGKHGSRGAARAN